MIAALTTWHEQHEPAAQALAPVTALPAHVLLEAFSVLTRLPSGLAVPATLAATQIARRFGRAPLHLGTVERASLLERLALAGVVGGAANDGLVALEANAHGRTLLTLDRRAQATYQRLGVAFRVIAD